MATLVKRKVGKWIKHIHYIITRTMAGIQCNLSLKWGWFKKQDRFVVTTRAPGISVGLKLCDPVYGNCTIKQMGSHHLLHTIIVLRLLK